MVIKMEIKCEWVCWECSGVQTITVLFVVLFRSVSKCQSMASIALSRSACCLLVGGGTVNDELSGLSGIEATHWSKLSG